MVKEDTKCKTCIFYGLCVAAELEHCEYEEYYKDVEEGKK